jgi:hypothetical protein
MTDTNPDAAETSGRQLEAITKTGSRHARGSLGEAARHYRRPPRRSKILAAHQHGQPAHVLALAWKAQQRLHHIWRRLDHQRGKRRTGRRGRRRPASAPLQSSPSSSFARA